MQTKPTTSRMVNAALKKLGTETILVRGNGYWYFAEGDTHMWRGETGVYGVARISDLTVEQWIEIYKERQNEFENN